MKYSPEMARAMAFGVPFNPTNQDAKLTQQLLDGDLVMAPHPAWKIPADITWYENPFGEVNWVAQFHMLRWLDPLRRSADAGNAEAAALWVRIVRSWIEKNPPGKGRATYTWADMVEAVRAMTMCFALPMIEQRHPDELELVLESIAQHGEWLADPKHIRTGNHALQQHQGLLVIGSVLERSDWQQLAIQRSVDLLRSDYDEEGINAEGASQYHQINFNWWNLVKRRVELVSDTVPAEFERIARAPLGLAHATRPDGNYELIGDTEIFALRGIDHPAVKYVQTRGTDGVAPAERVKVLSGGYVFGRSTWGSNPASYEGADFFSLRFGPQNRIHGHQDGMALTLYARKEPILVDSGKYAYDAKDAMRAYLLSRAAHNSVVVEGGAYAGATEVELERHHRTDEFEYFSMVDGGYQDVELRRQVLVSFTAQVVVVRDKYVGSPEATPEQLWHLNPGAGHRKTERGAVLARGENNFAWFVPASGNVTTRVVQGNNSPYRGWQSKTWRKAEPLRCISLEVPGNSVGLVTVIDYSNARDEPVVRESISDDDSYAFAIEREDASYDFAFGKDWGSFRLGRADLEDYLRVARDEFVGND